MRTAYLEARRGLLASQGQQEESARGQIKAREGFATLTADQSHHVLRPIAEALQDTTEDATSPGLVELKDQASPALTKAEEIANERLDQILSEGNKVQVRPIGHHLRNREIKSEQELETVLDELRDRVEPELRAGRHVRLVD